MTCYNAENMEFNVLTQTHTHSICSAWTTNKAIVVSALRNRRVVASERVNNWRVNDKKRHNMLQYNSNVVLTECDDIESGVWSREMRCQNSVSMRAHPDL